MNNDFQSRTENISAEDAAGQILTLGFNGTSYSRALGSWFRKYRPGGVILFSGNIENVEQTTSLISDLKKLCEDETGTPLFVCVDQEGGRVSRLSKDMPSFPKARSLGEDGSLELVEEVYADIGKTLRGLGFNVNFAPALDLDTNENNPIIGDRSFGADPETVGRLGSAAIRGLRREGILACGKHFPGHGDTSLDSHLDLPTDDRPASRFDDAELIPFRMAVEERVDFIMSAHVVYPKLDEKYPATLSRKIMIDLLRDKIGFEGVIVSDDLDMKAIAGMWSDDEAAKLALNAGADMILVCHEGERQDNVFEATYRMIDDGKLPEPDVKEKLARLMSAKSCL
ncbi:beta-N-acetylglucosaminidase [hydrothermal vent metagenome]|uniref:Beta-N-acetylglucosaminidase n=1 Tax=hydrothermal vent metagenome TaxID=652676 RepID=A0A3B1CXP5_9ZZZZ